MDWENWYLSWIDAFLESDCLEDAMAIKWDLLAARERGEA